MRSERPQGALRGGRQEPARLGDRGRPGGRLRTHPGGGRPRRRRSQGRLRRPDRPRMGAPGGAARHRPRGAQAAAFLAGSDATVLVLSGDVPLVRPETLEARWRSAERRRLGRPGGRRAARAWRPRPADPYRRPAGAHRRAGRRLARGAAHHPGQRRDLRPAGARPLRHPPAAAAGQPAGRALPHRRHGPRRARRTPGGDPPPGRSARRPRHQRPGRAGAGAPADPGPPPRPPDALRGQHPRACPHLDRAERACRPRYGDPSRGVSFRPHRYRRGLRSAPGSLGRATRRSTTR